MPIKNLLSIEAYELLEQNSDNSILIDVRTEEELKIFGVPDVKSEQFVFLSWRIHPDMSINAKFSGFLSQNFTNFDQHMLFLCAGGVRSKESAEMMHNNYGFKNCYNIIDGFTGSHSGAGWKDSNLPFKQFN